MEGGFGVMSPLATGCGSVWLERSVRDAEAARSNRAIPTIKKQTGSSEAGARFLFPKSGMCSLLCGACACDAGGAARPHIKKTFLSSCLRSLWLWLPGRSLRRRCGDVTSFDRRSVFCRAYSLSWPAVLLPARWQRVRGKGLPCTFCHTGSRKAGSGFRTKNDFLRESI